MIEEMERLLQRKLRPEERRFLILANQVFEKGRLREAKKSKTTAA